MERVLCNLAQISSLPTKFARILYENGYIDVISITFASETRICDILCKALPFESMHSKLMTTINSLASKVLFEARSIVAESALHIIPSIRHTLPANISFENSLTNTTTVTARKNISGGKKIDMHNNDNVEFIFEESKHNNSYIENETPILSKHASTFGSFEILQPVHAAPSFIPPETEVQDFSDYKEADRLIFRMPKNDDSTVTVILEHVDNCMYGKYEGVIKNTVTVAEIDFNNSVKSTLGIDVDKVGNTSFNFPHYQINIDKQPSFLIVNEQDLVVALAENTPVISNKLPLPLYLDQSTELFEVSPTSSQPFNQIYVIQNQELFMQFTIEWQLQEKYSLALCLNTDTLIGIAVCWDVTNVYYIDLSLLGASYESREKNYYECMSQIRHILENSKQRKAIFDLKAAWKILFSNNMSLSSPFFDPAVAAWILNPDLPKVSSAASYISQICSSADVFSLTSKSKATMKLDNQCCETALQTFLIMHVLLPRYK